MSMSIEECQTPRPGFPKPVPDTPTNVMQQFSMKGKVIIVTGAAEGIGGAVADAMAEAGGDVALWYNSYVSSSATTHVTSSNIHLPATPPL
jgi:sorbose reductase